MSCREQSQWYPSRWRPTRIRHFVKHVRDCAARELREWLSVQEESLFLAWFESTMGAAYSYAELRARGVKLLGDTEVKDAQTAKVPPLP